MIKDDIVEMANLQMKFAISGYITSVVIIVIFVIAIIIQKKSRTQSIDKNSNRVIPIFFGLLLLIGFFIDGICAHIRSNNFKKDIQEMITHYTSGEVEDIYIFAKNLYIVIDSNKYIFKEGKLDFDVSVGDVLEIEYLENSKLVVDVKRLNENESSDKNTH